MLEKKEINRLHLLHLGKIFSNFCILGVVILLFTGLIPALQFFWYVIGGVIFVLAFFIKLITAWQAPIELGELSEFLFGNVNGIIVEAYTALSSISPYVFSITAALAIAAVVLIAVFDRYKRKARIIISSVVLGLSVIAMLLIYVVMPGVIV